MLKKLFKIIAWIFGVIIVLIVALLVYVAIVARVDPPVPTSMAAMDGKVTEPSPGLFKIGNNWFRKSESGFYELYIEGDPFERGAAYGKLTKDLLYSQEKAFVDQLHTLVPSNTWINILRVYVGWFNRDLDDNIPAENRLEIFGVAESAPHDFDYIASAYQRMLNYHAAHDIGHALQNMSLVGCTSFATWDESSEDSSLIIGRNFDFYVGDDFARNKIIAFYNPSEGNQFMMVTFAGMTGVLSGMNNAGLSLTLNAAKSDIPSGSATPVSIVAREILQYATTIEEAYKIAQRRKTFVAESFLIGSAMDGKAAVIEKSPERCELFYGNDHSLVCTNHFQSDSLGNTELNKEHMRTSPSVYRYQRVEELLARDGKNSVEKTAAILRNQLGLNDADIGMGNEKLVNQMVAHHGIIFQPEKRLVWISTAPNQMGKFVCYDLNKIFSQGMAENKEVYEADLGIPADTFIQTVQYRDFLKYSKYRFPFFPKDDLLPDSVLKWNPSSYHSYMLAGDYYFDKKEYSKAVPYYENGLTREVASIQERDYMTSRIKECGEKQR